MKASTITVQSCAGLQEGDAIMVGSNGQILRITNIAPCNTITVTGHSLAERLLAWLFL